jgi:hypothetical protein
MDRLGYTTDTYKDLKFLGDAVYEQKLVEDMIMKATGNHYLNSGILDTNQQMMELYENAILENKRLGFEVGSYLTEDQAKSLEKDILWYVSKLVNNKLVLVPVLYLSKSTKERIENGTMSVISANTVNLEVGTIENRGQISGNKVNVVAEKDILNIDGKITANESLGLKAGNNLLNSSSVNKISIAGAGQKPWQGLAK